MNWFVLAIIAALIRGGGDVFRKKALIKEHAMQYLTTYAIIATVILLPVLPLLEFNLELKIVGLIYLKSLVFAVAILAWIKLMRHLEISEVAPLRNLSPIFLVFLSFFILKEKLALYQLGGIALLIVGVYVLESDHKISNIVKPMEILKNKRVLELLVFLILISFCAIIDKIVVATLNIYVYLFLTYLFLSINCIIVQVIFYKGIKDVKHVLKKSGVYAFFSIVMLVGANIAYLTAVAIPTAYIALIIPVTRLSSLVSTFIGGEMFHDKGLKMRVIACLIMVAGAVLVVL